MWADILSILFLLAPAGIANTSPIWAAQLPFIRQLSTPLDFGLKFRAQRVFGDHKTIRGMVAGFVAGGIAGLGLWFLYQHSAHFGAQVDLVQGKMNIILFGALMGLSALVGDAIFSFFKRQLKIKPGKAWVPFDQIDYILGAYLLVWLVLDLSWLMYFLGLIIYTALHPAFSYLGYILRWKKDPF